MFFSGLASLQDNFLTENWHRKYGILHTSWKTMLLVLKAFILQVPFVKTKLVGNSLVGKIQVEFCMERW